MIFRRGLLGFSSLLLMLLSACQSRQPADNAHATPAARPVVTPRPTSSRPAADSTPTLPARPEKQTLFPDTLHPIALSVQYWTGPQLDSLRAVLDADTPAILSSVEQWTNRCRVLRADDDYSTLRLFFRPLGATARWVELDLNAWLNGYNMLSYMQARVVELDQRASEELLVEMGGGNYASGIREPLSYTLLISFEGAPHVIWHSLDSHTQEVPPYQSNAQGEMERGNYASADRKITVRNGRVRVGRVRQEGKFGSGDELVLTPITPGSYQYRAGRFRRVAP